MSDVTALPHVLAIINGSTVVMLLAGYAYIRSGNITRHRACMMTAVGLAVLFLIIYIYYHLNAGLAKFGGEGAIRTVYFTILILHVVGALVLTPLVPITTCRIRMVK